MVDFEAHGEIATDLQSNLILHLNLQIDFNLHAKLKRIFVIFPIELRIFLEHVMMVNVFIFLLKIMNYVVILNSSEYNDHFNILFHAPFVQIGQYYTHVFFSYAYIKTKCDKIEKNVFL